MLSTSKSSHAPLALDVAEADAAVGKGWNLPAQLYVDPAVLALEERAIFRRAWQIVGTERDVQNAGDSWQLHHEWMEPDNLRDQGTHDRCHVRHRRNRHRPRRPSPAECAGECSSQVALSQGTPGIRTP